MLHVCASDVSFEDDVVEIDDQKEGILLTQELKSLFTDLKMGERQRDPQLQTGVRKFYNKMASNNSIALLASSFHCFGKTNGRTVTITKGGLFEREEEYQFKQLQQAVGSMDHWEKHVVWWEDHLPKNRS